MTMRVPAPVEGALWMILAGSCFAAMTGLIRPASETLHPLMVCFLRAVVGAVLMMPLLLRARGLSPSKHLRPVLVGRAVVDAGSMALWFVVIPTLPLATAIALNFTSPLFSVIFAIIFLGEIVRARRWAAIGVGFLGVLIIKQPTPESFDWPALFVLASAALAAMARVGARHLTRTMDAETVVAIHFFLIAPTLLVPALFVWSWPTAEAMAWIFALAICGTLGHFCIAKAVAVAEASEVAPFDYFQLVIAAAIGYFAYAEIPEPKTWLGAAVIAGSATYIARREARLRRARAGANG